MSSPTLGSAVQPSTGGVSTSIKSPIPRSGEEKKRGSKGEVDESDNFESVPPIVNRSSPGNGGVNDLLQRALSLKDGAELEDLKDGERTPGKFSSSCNSLP